MREVLSVENMRKSDAHTIESGIPGIELMRRAGKGIFESVAEWKAPVAIVCGTGNNAGDGYVLAGLLKEAGIGCVVFLISEKFSADGKYYYDKCVEKNIEIKLWEGEDFSDFPTIVDCIFGTGFKGGIRGRAKELVEKINTSKAFVVSVDINSGINGDTGLPGSFDQDTASISNKEDPGKGGEYIISDLTVSIGSFKPGHFLNMAKDVMKEKINIDIGIKPVDKAYYLIEKEDVSRLFTKRKNYSHKGTYGYTAIVGGSSRYSGAIRLAYLANTAMRSGAGVVKAGVPASLMPVVSSHILESTVFPLSDKEGELCFKEEEFRELIGNVKTVAFGMGIGISKEVESSVKFLLKEFGGRLIIDADGLNVLSKMERDIIRNAKGQIILTPHLKEFSRLSGLSMDEIRENPVKTVKEYAFDTGAIVLLKGSSTIITDGENTYIVDTGCPGMATAGSGDVLSGILSATCAYIDDPLMAVAAGAYINGKAGEAAEKKTNPVSMTAGDTAAAVSEVISEIIK